MNLTSAKNPVIFVGQEDYDRIMKLLKEKKDLMPWDCPCGGRNDLLDINCIQCGEPGREGWINASKPYPGNETIPETPKKEETWRDRPPML